MSSRQIKRVVAEAVARRQPVVALESALITHGFDYPANLHIARRIETAVREVDVVPATIALVDGEPHVGLSDEDLLRLASSASSDRPKPKRPIKVSLRDLPIALARGSSGGTTVAATAHLAHLAGIQVLCTGGIGGVHRDLPQDISADLTALGSLPLVFVCSGAKSILDLRATLEVLESKGVPVIGYGTKVFPAFYNRQSGFNVDVSVDTPGQVVDLVQMRNKLELKTGLLICVPVPEGAALAQLETESAIRQATEEAKDAGVTGKDLTPFLLKRIVALTDGKARDANEALLLNNARVAAHIARALVDVESHA